MSVALIDTTTYLKLGRALDPLLGRSVGTPPRLCRTISEVDREFEDKHSLAHTFYWVSEPSYRENRKGNFLSALSVGMKPVMQWRSQVQAYARMNSAEYRKRNITVPSPADCLLIAYAVTISEVHGKRAAVISDDAGVRFTVQELDLCDAWSGYQLVKAFLDSGYVDEAKVRAIYAELDYLRELPQDWRVNCQATFGFTHQSGTP